MKKISPNFLWAFVQALSARFSFKNIDDHFVFNEKKLKFISLTNYNYETENNPVNGKKLIIGVCIYLIFNLILKIP